MRSGFWTSGSLLFRSSLWASGLCLLSSACGLDPAATGPLPEEQRCIDVPQALPGLSAPTPLGITAQEVLNFSTGSHTDTLYWRNIAFGADLEFELAPITNPTTQLTTQLIPSGAPARWVQSNPEFPRNASKDILDCPDRLEIDVQLHIKSEDGALNATIPTTLVATSPHGATIRAGANLAEIPQGSLALKNTKPEGLFLHRLAYNLSYTPSAHYGELRGQAQIDEKRYPIELGTWPAPAPTPLPTLVHDCLTPSDRFYLPIDEPFLGFSTQGLADQIASANPLLMKPMSGPEASGQISFSATQDRLCVSSIQEYPKAEFRTRVGLSGLLRFQIGDRLTQIPAVAFSSVNGQAITDTLIYSNWNAKFPLRGALDAAGFRAAYGDFGLKLGAHPFYAIYSEVRYRSVAPGEQKKPLIGGLQVVGITPNPRQRSGAITELLARWEFRG